MGTGSPIIPDLTIANIQITPRLGGTSITAPPQWVKVSVTGYTFTAKLFGLIPLSVDFAPAVEMRYVGLNATL